MNSFNDRKILLIDNYDSFTYNLVQQLKPMASEVEVIKNDDVKLLTKDNFTHLIISPGPGDPSDSGFCKELILKNIYKKPILGVCLGHQIIGELYGAKISQASYPVHGKSAPIRHSEDGLFSNMPQDFVAARYHSLVIEKNSLPNCFKISASYDNIIMGIEHKEIPFLYGLQFHPESFLTQKGEILMNNFLTMTS